MYNLNLLNQKIKYEGIKLVVLSYKLGIGRTTLYERLKGKSEFTIDEIKLLIKVLHLNEKETKEIFNISTKRDYIQRR